MIGRLFELRGEQRAVRDVSWARWAAGGDLAATQSRVTAESAMGLLAVFGCVSLISDTIATLPVDVLQDREPVELPAWLDDPAPLDRVDFFSALLTGLLLEGNAVIAVGRDDDAT